MFTRLGVFNSEIDRVVSAYGYALNNGVDAIWNQFPNADQDAVAVEGLLTARDSYRNVHGSYLNTLVSDMSSTVVSQVNRDTPITPLNLSTALGVLVTQMENSSDSIQRATTSSSVTPWASNKGNAVINVALNDQFGEPLDMVFAENVTLTVSNDVSSGGTQYAETLSVAGQPAYSSTSYKWPGGSGALGKFNIFNALSNGLLSDGSFELWTSATPNVWTITTGAATVNKDSSHIIRGTYALKITSDGSTLTTVRQQLSNAVLPNIVYAVNFWSFISSADGSGVLRVRMTDSAGNTLVDDGGNSLTYSRNLNGQIGTAYTQVMTFFTTPRQLPSSGGVWLEFGFTTAPANTKIVYVDHLGLVAATQLYAGGPFVAAFSKDTANAVPDYYTVTVANSLTSNTYARALDRWFSLRQLGIAIPSSLSPTINISFS